jgi:hypothetical protein
MIEFIVIGESRADADIATKLAERILVEKIDWLEPEYLQYSFRWSGLQENTGYSCWRDIEKIIDDFQETSILRIPKYKRSRETQAREPLKPDAARAIKVLNLVRFLQRTREIRAVVFIRDLDHKPERREGLEQARRQHLNQSPKLEIAIGTANGKREAWVLNGFLPLPLNEEEQEILDEIKAELNFDPCLESYRLRSSRTEQNPKKRIRYVKYVVARLTGEDWERERQCWEETDLQILRERGIETGLTEYMNEIEVRLLPIVASDSRGT